jgi:DNA-binding NtrC family response regulator
MGTMAPGWLNKRHRVLIVEGDQDVRDTILTTLRKAGYAIADAAGSEEAVLLMGRDKFSSTTCAIVCDIRAPKIKGIEAATYFHVRYPFIPVIVTAAYPDIEWAITLMKRGVTDYLVKPISKSDLLMVLKNAADRYVTMTRGSL